jgi:hypothetical protein
MAGPGGQVPGAAVRHLAAYRSLELANRVLRRGIGGWWFSLRRFLPFLLTATQDRSTVNGN